MLNLDKLGPDWKFATSHGKANRAGRTTIGGHRLVSTIVCRCCHQPVQKQPVPLTQHSKQLQFLGFGFPLFYQFLKNCIFLLFILIISYNAISFRDAIDNNRKFCHEGSPTPPARLLGSAATLRCYTPFVQFARIQLSVSGEEQALRIISYIAHFIALLYVRNRLMKLDRYYNQRTASFVDFSVIIKRMEKMKGIQASLRQFFRKQFAQPHQILHLTLLPVYPQIDHLMNEKKRIIDQLRPYYDEETEKTDQEAIQLSKQLKAVETKILDMAHESKYLFQQDELECEKVICIFKTHREKEIIMKAFPKISSQVKQQYFGNSGVYMKTAPQPQQLIWSNVNLPKQVRVARIILGYFLSLLTLAGIFVAFFFILEQKSKHLAHAIESFQHNQSSDFLLNEYRGAIALVYLAMFMIVIFNKTIMSILFHKFTDLEKHSTTSKFQFSFELKLSIGFFFTTALMTLAVEALRLNNYYSHLYGVVDEQTIMFFMNSFFIPIFWLVNPFRLIKKMRRKMKYGKRSLTQEEANVLMQQDHYDMGKRFAEVIETMWFTYLYSSLLPIGALITIVGLTVYYWVDKYNLLRRSSINRQVSGTLINQSLTLLEFTLIFKPMGSLIFDKQLRDQVLASTIVMFVLAFVFVIIPKNRLLQFFNNEKFRQHQKQYSQLKHSFQNTYNTEHPIVRILHYEKIMLKLRKKNFTIDSQIGQTSQFYEPSPTHLVKSSKSIGSSNNFSTSSLIQE